MDIEEFLEQDILTFLDGSLEQPTQGPAFPQTNAFLVRDYEEEFFKALDAENVTQAKRVLHDLKAKFDEAPSGTPEKEQLKALLMTLYDKFKDHLDAEQSFTRIDDALSGMRPGRAQEAQAKEVPPAPKAPPVVAQARPVEAAPPTETAPPVVRPSQPAQEPPAIPAAPAVDGLLAHARDTLSRAAERAAGGDLRAAMQLYRDARKDALGMDVVPDDLAAAFLRTYATIKEAATRSPAPPSGTSPLDRQLILQLELQKTALDGQLHRNDIPGAMRTYKEMRLVAQQIADDRLAESVSRKLILVYGILKKFRTHADEKGLLRKVP